MVDRGTDAEVVRWRADATEAIASAVEAAPDATVPAYPEWRVRDLAVHVVTIATNATMALDSGVLERPRPELTITTEDEPSTLAAAVRGSMAGADASLEGCRHDVVWTPVGTRAPAFWQLRLLREAVLHRWDAEQAAGTAAVPAAAPSSVLIDHFFDTDVARAFASGDDRPSGVVVVRSGGQAWRVDMSRGVIDEDASGGAGNDGGTATISGDPGALMLWLMRREGPPAPRIDDPDGSADAFVALIDGFNRPAG